MKIQRSCRAVCLFTLLAACSCEEGTTSDADAQDAGADAGVVLDADAADATDGGDADARVEPDFDRDGIPDILDNCGGTPNPDQADLDLDGRGDICDTCPATPNPGTPQQPPCTTREEVEPNDVFLEAEQIILPRLGEILEITGTIEASTSSTPTPDRFVIVVPTDQEDWFAHVRLTRHTGSSVEPMFIVHCYETSTQIELGIPREADGEITAERDVFLPYGRQCEIRIGDRRTIDDGEPQGGPGFEYALSIEQREIEIEDLGLIDYLTPIRRTFEMTPPGSVKFVGIEFPMIVSGPVPDRLWRIDLSLDESGGPGLDPLLGRGGPDVDNYRADTLNAAMVFESIVGKGIVVLDHRRINGSNLTVNFEARWNVIEEVEPNNLPEQAPEYLPPFVAIGFYDPVESDEDWFKFWAPAGTGIALGCELAVMGGLLDPQIELFTVDQNVQNLLGRAKGGHELRNRLGAILPESREYFVRTRQEEGVPGEAFARYRCEAEMGPVPLDFPRPITSSTIYQSQQGLYFDLIAVSATKPTHVEISTIDAAAGFEPFIRVFGPGGVGLIAEGSLAVAIDLAGEPFPYVVSIHNGLDFHEDVSGDPHSFELDVQLTPQ